MARDLFVLSDLSACWRDEEGRTGARGRVRPMRVLLAREDPEAHRPHPHKADPQSYLGCLVLARHGGWRNEDR